MKHLRMPTPGTWDLCMRPETCVRDRGSGEVDRSLEGSGCDEDHHTTSTQARVRSRG